MAPPTGTDHNATPEDAAASDHLRVPPVTAGDHLLGRAAAATVS